MYCTFLELKDKYFITDYERETADGAKILIPSSQFRIEYIHHASLQSCEVTMVEPFVHMGMPRVRIYRDSYARVAQASKSERRTLAFAEIATDNHFTEWKVFKLIEG